MAITGPDILLYEKENHVVTITLNRPERMNTISDSELWSVPQKLDKIC
jgi:enoyl-CoA hydratase/carnithine racemase